MEGGREWREGRERGEGVEEVSGQSRIGVLMVHAQWPSGVRLRH